MWQATRTKTTVASTAKPAAVSTPARLSAKLTLGAILAVALLAIALVTLLAALVATPAGTQVLAGQAKRWMGDTLQWRELEGSLTGPLTIRDLHLSRAGLEIDARAVSLDWQPGRLFNARLELTRFEVDGLRVALTPSEPAPAGESFNPADLQPPIDIALHGVKIRDLQLTQDDQPPLVIDSVELEAELVGDKLSLQQLAIRLPQGGFNIRAETALREVMPLQLNAAWGWHLVPPDTDSAAPLNGELSLGGAIDWADHPGVDIDYGLLANGTEQLNPQLPAQFKAEGKLVAEYRGEELGLKQLTLALAQSPLQLRLSGDATLPDDDAPGFDLQLQWTDLQWPLASDAPQVVSAGGKLTLSGSTAAYQLLLATRIAGDSVPVSQWQMDARGDLSHLQFTQLQGKLLGGELATSGWVGWQPVPRWDLQLYGRDLDPALLPAPLSTQLSAQLAANLTGQLAFALRSSGQAAPDQPLQASAQLKYLRGTLMERSLEASAELSVTGENLLLQSLALRSEGNQFTANGAVASNAIDLDWQLEAPATGALLPGASGAVTANGSVTGNAAEPRVQAQVQSERLALDALQMANLQMHLRAGLGRDDPLSLTVTSGVLQDGDQVLLQSVKLGVQGTTSQHQLNLVVDRGSEQVQLELKGGPDAQFKSWQGELSQMAVQSASYGGWTLREASTLSLAADKVTLGHSCLQDTGGPAQLCTEAGWMQTGTGQARAELRALPVGLLLPTISGDLNGEVKAALAANGALRAEASLRLSPGQIKVDVPEGIEPLAHGGGDIELSIASEGLVARLNFEAPERGKLDAELQLPQFTSLPLQQPQPLTGQVRASLPDLSGLAAWVPDVSSSSGRLNADIRLSGNLEQPQIQGEFQLEDAGADISVAGLRLQQIELTASSDPNRPEHVNFSGGLTSGPGRVDINGEANLQSQQLALQLQGEKLEVFNTPDARALLSPDLQIGWSDNILKLRGKLLIPRADITPQLGLRPSTISADQEVADVKGQIIAPSSDVVIVNGEVETSDTLEDASAPFKIDSKVQLVMGDKVRVRALGFISRIAGAVTFTNTVDQKALVPRAKGLLSLEDGTFRAYGQDLEIQTGQLIFANVPATQPELNLRAVRWIENDPQVTSAGVLVTGTVTEPTLELFSQPQLEPTEIQSYLLTGRSSADRDTVLSYGTYIQPKIYVGYGYSLLEDTSEFNALFTITPRYGLGVNVGEADSNLNFTFTHEN